MSESDNVLVDTSLWVGFLAGEPNAVTAIETLRRSHHVVVCGQIMQEILQGSRDQPALAMLERQFAVWDREAEQPEDFVQAARTYARLRWNGITVPPADCLIAALATRCGLRVCATDPHFERIPGLRRYPLPG